MVPERRRPLVVRVLEHRRARLPRRPDARLRLRPEARRSTVPTVAKPAGMFARRGQVPGLGVAVALLARVAAVQVGHDRHRAGVGRRACALNVRRACRVPSLPPGGLAQCSVGSTGSRCGRKLPLRVHQVVDPLHPHRPPVPGLDGEGGVVERTRGVHRAVAPDRRLGEAAAGSAAGTAGRRSRSSRHPPLA